ncbi:MAG: dihydroxyacetone kinase subunit DhaK, partial [Caldilineae bacterium]
MRHFVSDPGGPITDSLQGMALYHADLLRVHFDPDYVVRRELGPPGKVAVVTGSGSGH